MAHSRSAVAEVRFGGLEGALTLLVTPGPSGALVSDEARIECGPLDGRVSAVLDLDLDQLRDEIGRLLDEPTLTGDVLIAGSEHGTFSARLRLDHGRGTVAISLESESEISPAAERSRSRQTRLSLRARCATCAA